MARGSKVWLNGEIIPTEMATVSLFTHALHYGTGCFEGIRAYKQKNGGGAVFRLAEHMERLLESVKILGLSLPYTAEQLNQAALETVRANGFEECYIRPLVYIADGPLGLNPTKNPPVHIAILVWEWGAYLGDDGVEKGIRLRTSSYNRPQVNSIMTKGKITGHYVTSVLTKQEALRDGYDEGLLLDTEGYVSEGSGENIFIVKNGVIKTTPLNSILAGITRRTVIEHLTHQGLTVVEERFTRDECWCADEVFLTGTAAEITPVREIDNRAIGTGKPGPIGSRLQREYNAMVRGDVPEYGREWLTRI